MQIEKEILVLSSSDVIHCRAAAGASRILVVLLLRNMHSRPPLPIFPGLSLSLRSSVPASTGLFSSLSARARAIWIIVSEAIARAHSARTPRCRDDCPISDRIILACDAGCARSALSGIYILSRFRSPRPQTMRLFCSTVCERERENSSVPRGVYLERPITRDFQGRSQYFFIRGVYKAREQGPRRQPGIFPSSLILPIFLAPRAREIASAGCAAWNCARFASIDLCTCALHTRADLSRRRELRRLKVYMCTRLGVSKQ